MYTQVILNLLLVLGMVCVYMYATYKLKSIKSSKNQLIEVISMLGVGQKEKIILLRVEGQQLLVGVTAHNISILSTIKSESDVAKRNESNELFAQKIQEAERNILVNRNIQ